MVRGNFGQMQEKEKKQWKRFDGRGFTESEALIGEDQERVYKLWEVKLVNDPRIMGPAQKVLASI